MPPTAVWTAQFVSSLQWTWHIARVRRNGDRLGQRIPVQPFRDRFGRTIEEEYGPILEQLTEWGLVDVSPDWIALTRKGQLYLQNRPVRGLFERM